MTSLANPVFSIVWFFITTIILFIVRYMTSDSAKTIYFIIYILLLMGGEFFINLQLSASLCGGAAQMGTALIVTFVPWIIIFGLLNVMLIVFKGWKTPFSNTFGYLVTRLMGVNGLLMQILKPENDKSLDTAAQRGLEQIYNDKSLFINQLYLDDYDKIWDTMGNYFRPGVSDELKNKLKNMVFLKDLVSEFMWFSLTGCLVTSVAYNYMVNSRCSKSAKDLHKHHDAVKSQSISDHEKKQAAPKPRIYKIQD